MFFPRTCPVCRRPSPGPCGLCLPVLLPAPALAAPAGVDRCHALLAYEGPSRELVARLKYRNERSALAWLARSMAGLVDAEAVDAVTWLPTTDTRRRARGFDQSVLLARAVARRLDRPCVRLLRRLPGPAQTGRPAAARRLGPRLQSARASPGRVLLVDDVITTGSSASAAAAVLRGAGARQVLVVAAARTPLRPRRPGTITPSA